ncbi:hypothetical protein DICVIV_12152 [Dictyocaulus viviparus]|uniref:Protein kinase domain-containing protein n=1 Tax=Dictyocaulus viviparus TaxID=29172 RepID=A0A0D8XDM1_DICVI|nr:hypothetical protein DICVIV_12152 [Dictyocaulus viviparus]
MLLVIMDKAFSAKVTHALSLVHGIGFLHRDLKPSNCCVGVDDVTRIYLLDYVGFLHSAKNAWLANILMTASQPNRKKSMDVIQNDLLTFGTLSKTYGNPGGSDGLTRQYLDSSGLIRKPRESIGMRGTLRYVSLEAHSRHDLGPNHDLVALLYSILGDGKLPWSKMREESAIKASKMETTVEKLCEKQPKMLKMAENFFFILLAMPSCL